jgi:hypothetical protein
MQRNRKIIKNLSHAPCTRDEIWTLDLKNTKEKW